MALLEKGHFLVWLLNHWSLRDNWNVQVVPKKKRKLECVAEALKSCFTKNIRCFVKDERTGILKGLWWKDVFLEKNEVE